MNGDGLAIAVSPFCWNVRAGKSTTRRSSASIERKALPCAAGAAENEPWGHERPWSCRMGAINVGAWILSPTYCWMAGASAACVLSMTSQGNAWLRRDNQVESAASIWMRIWCHGDGDDCDNACRAQVLSRFDCRAIAWQLCRMSPCQACVLPANWIGSSPFAASQRSSSPTTGRN